jgi:hypothetical protein
MSSHRLVLGVVVVMLMGVAAIAVALAGSSGEGAAPSVKASKSPASAGVYAYMRIEFGENSVMETQGELVVMDGTEQIGSAPFGFVGTRPEFTTDGQYVFTELLGDELAVVSAESGNDTEVRYVTAAPH